MTSQMSSIVNDTLDRVEQPHDYVQLFFASGAIVNINNPYHLEGCDAVAGLAGATVASTAEDEASLTIDFGKRGRLIVDLRPEAFDCPEAIELHRPDAASVIWTA